jgi:hypothetical protein
MITHTNNSPKSFVGINPNMDEITFWLEGLNIASVQYTIVKDYATYYVCQVPVSATVNT